MEKKPHKILVAGSTSINMINVLQALKEQGAEVMLVDRDGDDIPEPPKLPEIKLAKIDYGPPRKPKKDKTHLKRYSSYFNKKSK